MIDLQRFGTVFLNQVVGNRIDNQIPPPRSIMGSTLVDLETDCIHIQYLRTGRSD